MYMLTAVLDQMVSSMSIMDCMRLQTVTFVVPSWSEYAEGNQRRFVHSLRNSATLLRRGSPRSLQRLHFAFNVDGFLTSVVPQAGEANIDLTAVFEEGRISKHVKTSFDLVNVKKNHAAQRIRTLQKTFSALHGHDAKWLNITVCNWATACVFHRLYFPGSIF